MIFLILIVFHSNDHRYKMAEIMPIRRLTQINQSVY